MKSVNDVKQFIIELLKLFPENKTDYVHIGKAYYYANLFALEDYSTLVSIHRCIKMQFGPGIDSYKEIFDDMEKDSVITKEKPYHIKLIASEDKKYADFPKEIIDSIKKAYTHVQDKDFDQLTDETHDFESYKKARMYEEIDYLNDIFTDEEINKTSEFLSSIPHFT